jgi:multisubunit Na+/H+ antiporter MnhF subunit
MSRRVGVNDPQFLGTVFTLCGMLIYVMRENAALNVVVAALLFTLGIFTKQNLVALPIAIVIHAGIRRKWHNLLIMALSGFAFSGAIILLTLSENGTEFFSNIISSRAIRLGEGAREIGVYCGVFSAPILLAASQIKIWPCSNPKDLLAISLVVTHIVALVFVFGDGVGRNIFLDSLIILAIWCGIGSDQMARAGVGDTRPRTVPIRCMIMPLLPVFLLAPGLLETALREVNHRTVVRTNYLADVAFLSSINDPVICEHIQMCYDAGRKMFYDPYFVLDQVILGRISEVEVAELLQTKRISAVELAVGLDETTITGEARRRFSRQFMEILVHNYVLKRMGGGFAILVPMYGVSNKGHGRAPRGY